MRAYINIALVAVLGSSFHASAQLWCPPGAFWEFNIITANSMGCGTVTYQGDTLIGGVEAQRLVEDGYAHSFFDNNDYYWEYIYHTRVEDGIIYRYTSTQTWDTLFWMSAVPGDRWYPPDQNQCPAYPLLGTVEVVDTGTTDVNGTMLRYVDVHQLDEFGDPGTDPFRIHERLGSPYVWLFAGGCLIVEFGYRLRTYADDLGTIYDSMEIDACTLITGTRENDPFDGLEVYPNPGNGRIWIRGASGSFHMDVRSVDGTLVHTERTVTSSGSVDLGPLAPGVYLITFRTSDGAVSYVKWMKE